MKGIAIKRFYFIIPIAAVLLFSQCLLPETDDGSPEYNYISQITANPDDFANPERGWYLSRGTDDVSLSSLNKYKNINITIVMLEADLGAYASKELDNRKLDEIKNAFSNARKAGLSVIFRAAYTFDDNDYDKDIHREPSDFNLILRHIEQLGPIFRENEDILFNVQAGFLGPWGEWHSSRFGPRKDDPADQIYRQQVADALLKEVPESVSIAVRRPEYIRSIVYGGTPPGKVPAVTAEEAFGDSKIARLAFHNDALMSEYTDMDTYIDKKYPREDELDWVHLQTRYTPMVAETNQKSSYNDAENAIPLLDRINIQSLNVGYHPGVLQKWVKAKKDGRSAFDYITIRLGYRFVLNSAEIKETDQYGANLRLDLEITNEGFGHLLKEKNFELILKQGNEIHRAKINEDVRRTWNKSQPGEPPIKGEYYFKLPSSIGPGNWDVYIGLVSTFSNLADNPAYSVRFADGRHSSGGNMWDAALGLNKIGTIELKTGGAGDEFIQVEH